MFLTAEELHALTGYRRAHDQLRWLRERAWPCEIGGDGKPRVLRQVVLRKLGAETAESEGPRLRLPKAA